MDDPTRFPTTGFKINTDNSLISRTYRVRGYMDSLHMRLVLTQFPTTATSIARAPLGLWVLDTCGIVPQHQSNAPVCCLIELLELSLSTESNNMHIYTNYIVSLFEALGAAASKHVGMFGVKPAVQLYEPRV